MTEQAGAFAADDLGFSEPLVLDLTDASPGIVGAEIIDLTEPLVIDLTDPVASDALVTALVFGWPRAAKRMLDLVGSLVLLIVLSPVLLIAALAIVTTSRGPVLFVQERLGRNGHPFRMLKFRSMYRDADEQKAELAEFNETTGPVFKIRNDPRITPVGRVLRKLSIDELPQLVNVLLGDMSLVGPRPPLREEYLTYTPRERQRLAVKPGLTCYWQVSGRSDLDFDTWVEMDLAYIREWSLLLDLKLLVRTLPAVLSGRGAY